MTHQPVTTDDRREIAQMAREFTRREVLPGANELDPVADEILMPLPRITCFLMPKELGTLPDGVTGIRSGGSATRLEDRAARLRGRPPRARHGRGRGGHGLRGRWAGYTTDFAVERYWREGRLTKIFEGT